MEPKEKYYYQLGLEASQASLEAKITTLSKRVKQIEEAFIDCYEALVEAETRMGITWPTAVERYAPLIEEIRNGTIPNMPKL